MIVNNTLRHNITTINETLLIDYDTDGAMIYIIIVVLWYSIGIVFMLAMQISTRSEGIEHSARHRTRFLIRNIRDHNNTKEILEELVDKKYRDRLWDIYWGTTRDTKSCLVRAENTRIRLIEKQLATIKRNHRLTQDTFSPSKKNTHPDPSTTLRRCPSFDQWKQLANQSEQLPWSIGKSKLRTLFST